MQRDLQSVMNRSALRLYRQQLLTPFLLTQLGLYCRIRDGTQRSEELAQRLADVELAAFVYPTVTLLMGANLLNKYWMPTSLSLQRK